VRDEAGQAKEEEKEGAEVMGWNSEQYEAMITELEEERDQEKARAGTFENEILRLRAALKDFAEHGLRCDLNPTMEFKNMTMLYGRMTGYLKRADENVRERARRALK
jgi:hypothetical protein